MIGVSLTPNAADGYVIYKKVWQATTGGVSIKSSYGNVYGWSLSNTNTAPRFVKLYDLATAPVAGTSTPTITLMVPGVGSGGTTGAVAALNVVHGAQFFNGIGINVTAVGTDSDNTAPAANDVVINLFYS